MTKQRDSISDYLSRGEKNAIPARDLAELIHGEKRDVFKMVRQERVAGNPICSNSKGFFLAENNDELKRTIIRLYKQAKETKFVAETLQKISIE